MKKYGLFMYSDYYPEGGFNDFVIDFDSIQEIEDLQDSEVVFNLPVDVIQIVNFKTKEVYKYNVYGEGLKNYNFTKEDLVTILSIEFECFVQ